MDRERTLELNKCVVIVLFVIVFVNVLLLCYLFLVRFRTFGREQQAFMPLDSTY